MLPIHHIESTPCQVKVEYSSRSPLCKRLTKGIATATTTTTTVTAAATPFVLGMKVCLIPAPRVFDMLQLVADSRRSLHRTTRQAEAYRTPKSWLCPKERFGKAIVLPT